MMSLFWKVFTKFVIRISGPLLYSLASGKSNGFIHKVFRIFSKTRYFKHLAHMELLDLLFLKASKIHHVNFQIHLFSRASYPLEFWRLLWLISVRDERWWKLTSYRILLGFFACYFSILCAFEVSDHVSLIIVHPFQVISIIVLMWLITWQKIFWSFPYSSQFLIYFSNFPACLTHYASFLASFRAFIVVL